MSDTKLIVTKDKLDKLATSISTKSGVATPMTIAQMKAAVDGISGGGGGGVVPRKDVNFIDYDGTIVYSYSASEFADLAEMPQNPSHTGLVAQGWNWSLTDAKSQVEKSGGLTIGQMYITDDGKTRIYIHLCEERKSPILGVCPNGTVDVDWGDGTEHDTLTGTSLSDVKWTPTHNYSSGGDYVIKLTVTGSMAIVGTDTSNQYCQLLHYSSGTSTINMHYINAITKVEIGADVVISSQAFRYCCRLTSVTIPDSVTSIGDHAFTNCYGFTNLVIPDSVTSIGSSAFGYCYSLTSITIPDSVTSIDSSVFTYCYNLTNLVIPDNVTSIGDHAFNACYSITNLIIPDSVTNISAYTFNSCYSFTNLVIPGSVTSIGNIAFAYCYGITEYHLLPTAPPTLSNTNAFNGITDDCIIYVPRGRLNAYKTATNWSTYADKMREESA